MLVCNVVVRPRGRTLAADIAEIVAAGDAFSLGVIFATLTDDNGAAIDTVGAFVGQMMTEAASAAAVVDAGSIRFAAIVEQTNAGAAPGAIVLGPGGGIAAPMAETATATATQDATAIAALVARQAMAGSVMVNSDGTARQANADGIMLNL